MGLDITAYSRAVYLPEISPAEYDDEAEDTVLVYAYAGFERSTRGLAHHDVRTEQTYSSGESFIAQGVYDVSGSDSLRWRAGSYLGYGQYRNMLAEIGGIQHWRAANGRSSQTLKDWVLDNQDKPFFEQVWFADNEGCLGPEAAADLLGDYQAHRDAVVLDLSRREWLDVYDLWIAGLTLAADHGLVVLH